MTLPFQLQIPKRNPLCALGDEALTAGMAYYSLLSDNGELRKDFCTTCWKKFLKSEDGKSAVRYWKSKVPLKKIKAFLTQDKDAHVFSHFRKMLETSDSQSEVERFVLSLYLARRRLVALRKEEKQEETIFQIYEVLATEELFSIKKVNLLKAEIEAIQLRIAEKLQHEP